MFACMGVCVCFMCMYMCEPQCVRVYVYGCMGVCMLVCVGVQLWMCMNGCVYEYV